MVGKGSLFEILLPVTIIEVEPEVGIAQNLQYGLGEHIIWVDDEKSLVALGCQILESLNYTAHGFIDPVECLAAVQAQPDFFSLIITDFTMPRMTGLQLARHINDIVPCLPVILCSGYSETVTPNNAKANGLHNFLMKPVRKSDIARAVAEALSPEHQ